MAERFCHRLRKEGEVAHRNAGVMSEVELVDDLETRLGERAT